MNYQFCHLNVSLSLRVLSSFEWYCSSWCSMWRTSLVNNTCASWASKLMCGCCWVIIFIDIDLLAALWYYWWNGSDDKCTDLSKCSSIWSKQCRKLDAFV